MSVRSALLIAAVIVSTCTCSAGADELTPAILDPALAIQAALAKDSLEGVQANAATIEEQATKLGAPAAKLASAAKELKGAVKLADARTAFGKVSDELVAY